MQIIDHTDPFWNKAYLSRNQENGAATYSRELVHYQVPVLERLLSAHKVTVSTAPLLRGKQPVKGGDLCIQYLHEWDYKYPLRSAKQVQAYLRRRYRHILFITAYQGLCEHLNREGMDAIWVPMSLDPFSVANCFRPKDPEQKAIAYYGNVTRKKVAQYDRTLMAMQDAGVALHHIKGDQKDCWMRLSQYTYGMGVGRCAMEMSALGLKVIINGSRYGGLVLSEKDYVAQVCTNFNGRVVTGPATLEEAIKIRDKAILWNPVSSSMAAATLESHIREYAHGRGLCLPTR